MLEENFEMKLQKHFAYKYKDKEHYKNVIILPEETVDKLGWGAGIELKEQTDGNTLMLRPTGEPKQKSNRSNTEPTVRTRRVR